MDRLTRRAEAEGIKAVYYGKNDVFLEGEPGYAEANKLAHYEDLEESGRLVVLPCKVGETVYQILQKGSGHWEEDKYILDDRGTPKIYERGFHLILLNDIGKTIFLTREEAEAALEGGGQDE